MADNETAEPAQSANWNAVPDYVFPAATDDVLTASADPGDWITTGK